MNIDETIQLQTKTILEKITLILIELERLLQENKRIYCSNIKYTKDNLMYYSLYAYNLKKVGKAILYHNNKIKYEGRKSTLDGVSSKGFIKKDKLIEVLRINDIEVLEKVYKEIKKELIGIKEKIEWREVTIINTNNDSKFKMRVIKSNTNLCLNDFHSDILHLYHFIIVSEKNYKLYYNELRNTQIIEKVLHEQLTAIDIFDFLYRVTNAIYSKDCNNEYENKGDLILKVNPSTREFFI